MADDFMMSHIETCERDIKENEREIAKLKPQVEPLQEAVNKAYDDMEAARAFAESCERDFNDAVDARNGVTDHIDHREQILERDNNRLNAALRSRWEEEKKAARKAARKTAREGKRREREAA